MKIFFCGHSTFCGQSEYREALMSLPEGLKGEKDVEFYLGGYGAFDNFAYKCCKEYKKTSPVSLSDFRNSLSE